ncbi:DMT family transporter [Alcaligenaceae bacterium A4P071]|nr:DMT family transporter [Alcaligenaceae bacterium A4P071]
MTVKRSAYVAFALLGVIWGSNFIFMKWAVAWITPGQVVLLRVLFGFVPLLVYALMRGALHWRDLRHAPHFLVMALLATALYYYAFAQGAALLPSSVAGMLSGAIPLFTFLAAMLFLREERLNRRIALGIALGFAGVLLIAKPWEMGQAGFDARGVAYMVLGSLSVGVSFVYARLFITRLRLTPLALSTYQTGMALILIALVTDLHGIDHILQDSRAVAGVVLGLGLLGTGVAYMLYYFIVDRLGAVAASGVTYLPPIVALGVGVVLVHEPVQMSDLIAVAAILIGVYVLQRGRSARAAAA